MITVTAKAAEKALTIAAKEGRPSILRVGVRGGGCSGLSYFMEFSENITDNDATLEVGNLKVVCDLKSLKYLEGTVLDYESNLLKGGFKFNNPQAKHSCSCGESFAIR